VGSLRYRSDSGKWIGLPGWAEFFRAIGQAAVERKTANERLIAGVAVPTRAFAAAFAALGAVEARLKLTGDEASALEQFETLCGLKPGDSVTVLQAGKKYKATFVRRETVFARDGIWVLFEKDGVKNFIPAEEADRVKIGSLGKDSLPKAPWISTKRPHSWDAAFVEEALGVDDAALFARQDDFAALIIGQLSTLSYELETANFGVRSGEKMCTGHIEDLIRTKKFADDSAGEAFRTEVMSDRARFLDPAVAALEPSVVIFDGGRAFEKHHQEWLHASWVIVLDESTSAAEDGANILNQFFVESRLDDGDPLKFLEPPPATELVSFMAGCS
jgi:hypothetical protein